MLVRTDRLPCSLVGPLRRGSSGMLLPFSRVIEQTYLNLNELEPNLQSVIEHPAELIPDQENPQAPKGEHKCLLLEAEESGGLFVSQHYYGNSCRTSRSRGQRRSRELGLGGSFPSHGPVRGGLVEETGCSQETPRGQTIIGGTPVSGDPHDLSVISPRFKARQCQS